MYRVREATAADSEQVVIVLRRSITEVCAADYPDPTVIDDWLRNKTVQNVDAWIASENAYSVVCEREGAGIVGFALATRQGEIMLCYLVPEALHLGNGRLMLRELERCLAEAGVTEMRTISSITARHFYKRNGYQDDGDPILVGDIEGDFPMIKKSGI